MAAQPPHPLVGRRRPSCGPLTALDWLAVLFAAQRPADTTPRNTRRDAARKASAAQPTITAYAGRMPRATRVGETSSFGKSVLGPLAVD